MCTISVCSHINSQQLSKYSWKMSFYSHKIIDTESLIGVLPKNCYDKYKNHAKFFFRMILRTNWRMITITTTTTKIKSINEFDKFTCRNWFILYCNRKQQTAAYSNVLRYLLESIQIAQESQNSYVRIECLMTFVKYCHLLELVFTVCCFIRWECCCRCRFIVCSLTPTTC